MGWKVGDRVVGNANIVGADGHMHGGFAEEALVSAESSARIPDWMSYDTVLDLQPDTLPVRGGQRTEVHDMPASGNDEGHGRRLRPQGALCTGGDLHSEVTVKEMKNHLKAKGIAVPSKNMLVATATAIVNDMSEIAEAAAVASPKAQDGEDGDGVETPPLLVCDVHRLCSVFAYLARYDRLMFFSR